MLNFSWFDSLMSIIAFPFQLTQYVVVSTLDFLFFQVLQLGPYLPIQLY